MVKSVTAILLHAISADMECWTTGTKELAAQFLLTLLLFAESNITMHLQPVLKLMHKAVAEPSIFDKVSLKFIDLLLSLFRELIVTELFRLSYSDSGECEGVGILRRSGIIFAYDNATYTGRRER